MRKAAILNNNELINSPRRRSIIPQVATSPHIINDDEDERSKRRNNSELQKRVSNLGVVNRSNTISDGEILEFSESKLQDHFQTCVKLFSENKINAKNAWNVHIIEYMRQMLKKNLVMKDTLKLASTSIDIGSKVYCIRVDEVHNEMFKLANAMARVNFEEKENMVANEDAGEATEEEDGTIPKKKEKKKTKSRINIDDKKSELYVATNESSITAPIVAHNSTIQQVSSGKNRLYTLSVATKRKWGWEQMVNCRSNFPHFSLLRDDSVVTISDEKVPVSIPDATSQICPSFMDFVIDVWQPDDDDVPIGTQPQRNSTQNELVYDDNGLPIPELDVSVHTPNDDQDHFLEDEEVVEEIGAAHGEIRRPVAFITEMRPGQGSCSDTPLQYSYRTAPLVSERYMLSGVWAGPSHWKIKCLQRRRTTTNHSTEHVNGAPLRAKRNKREEPQIINFVNESDVEEDTLLPIRKNKIKRRILHGDLSKVTLPEDLFITRELLCSLKFRPEVQFSIEAPVEANAPDTSRVDLNVSANYQYDNPDDADYCSQNLNGDDAAADGDDNEPNDLGNDALEQTWTNDMINMPTQVQKLHVHYATQAKRMDMKKLKDALWNSMIVTKIGNDQIRSQTAKINDVTFNNVYEDLPNHVTSKMSEELTSPLAFVALLHLCNEETLKLNTTADFSNLIINTDK